MPGIAIWITGLPGSGKSTIADEIKKLYPEIVILRMDELRKTVTPEPTYSDTEREMVYRSLVYLAKRITDLGHDVIIDATANLRKWRELARLLIKRYMEVYLKCPIDVCMEREKKRLDTRQAPKDIYKKGFSGWPVPGLAAPYEEPLNAELVINTDKASLNEIRERIQEQIGKLEGS